MLHLQDAGGLGHLGILFLFGSPSDGQAKGHIRAHRHMREDGIGLKGHGHPALCGRQIVDQRLTDPKVARRDIFKPRDHAQKR
jgi:hypothetical protein